MKYKILQLDANGRISFTKEELEKLLDEVYEDGRRDERGWRYTPYITCTTGPYTTIPNKYDTIITCDTNNATCSTTSANIANTTHTSVTGWAGACDKTGTTATEELYEAYKTLDKVKYGLKD